MRASARIFLFLLAAALMAVACRKTMDADDPRLLIWLDIEAPAETKADAVGPVVAEANAEDSIKDLKIWVFLNEDVDEGHLAGSLIGYLNPTSSTSADPLTNYENRYHIIPLDRAIAQAKPKVDIYAIGNASSAGQSNLSAETSRADLDALVISGQRFGVKSDSKPNNTSISAGNMPYTGVRKAVSMTGSYPVLRVETVTLRKAVTKFRFVLCQLRDEVGEMINKLKVTGLSFDTGLISNKEYLFNDSEYDYKLDGYITKGVTLLASTDSPISPALNAAPEEYVFNPPADPSRLAAYAQEYETLILNGIRKGVLTDYGKCYLRETDKRITGTISYSIDGTPQDPVAFSMLNEGDFARGRSWIVYIYFLRDAMRFSVSWSPWTDGREFDLTPSEN